MGNSIAGLVLQAHAVDAFEATGGAAGVRLTKSASAPIEAMEEAQVVGAIKAAMARADIHATRIGISVPAQEVLVRSFTMPLLPRAEWDTAVQFEVRKYIPFKTHELIWTYHASPHPVTKQLDVVFVGIRSEVFAKLQGWLKTAQLTPLFIEAQAVGLARLTPRAPTASPNEFIGLVDVDPDTETAQIVIARDQIPYFARVISLKREPLPTQESGQPPPASLESRGEGQPQGGTGPSTPPDPRAEILLSELRLSVDFFTRENPQASIQQIMLFGERSGLETWSGWLGGQLPFPVTVGTLPLERRVSDSPSLQQACAVGLALRAMHPVRIKLDFVEPSVSRSEGGLFSAGVLKRLDLAVLRAAGKTVGLQLGLAAVAVGLLSAIGYHQVSQAKRQMTQTIQTFQDVGWGLKNKSVSELKALQDRAAKQVALLRGVVDGRVSVSEKLQALAQTFPDGMWLEGLTYKGRADASGKAQYTLTIEGACFLPQQAGQELQAIGQFAEALKAHERFFRGFQYSQLGQVGRQESSQQQISFQTFELNYLSGRRL